VTSRESIFVFRITTARSGAPEAVANTPSLAKIGGFVSRTSRCRVQPPPLITFDGIPGSGMIEPTSPLVFPAYSNDVM
jgi:hypothetical protein